MISVQWLCNPTIQFTPLARSQSQILGLFQGLFRKLREAYYMVAF